MRRLPMCLALVIVSACALGQGIDPDSAVATTVPPSATTIAIDDESRSAALDVARALVDAILRRDGSSAADLATDPPGAVQEEIDDWADAIGLVSGSFEVTSDAFTATSASIEVALDLELREVGAWSYTTTVTLVGGDPWSAVWSPAVLHPALEAGDVLRVDRQWLPRAPILARDGSELAGAEAVKVIGVVPAWIEDLDALTVELQRLVSIDPATVITQITRPAVQPDWFVPVGTIKQVIYAALGDEIEAIPGVVLRDGSERLPFRTGFAHHLVGTTGPITADQVDALGFPYGPTDTIGQTGIEAAYEEQLAGRPRTAIVRVNRFGRVVEDLLVIDAVEPQPVLTTIDPDVQTAIEQALDDDERPIGVVVLDASTGEVRGSASRPLGSGFDRAVNGTYPPGSTFKIVTTTALLESGYTAATELDCPSSVTIDGRAFRNAGDTALGAVTLREAFAASCNTTFATAATEALTAETLARVAERFGFGWELSMGIPGADPEFPVPVDAADLAAAAIGQSRVLSSPIHMASVAGAVAAGAWRPPTVISIADRAQGVELDRSAISTLADMMRTVVESGTGTNAAVPGVIVRGKTGSAEFGTGDEIQTHAWFVGYWDGLAIAVVVEAGGGGGAVAAPIASEIISALSG